MTTQTSLLRLILPVQGEFSGTWGDQVNAGLTNLLDTAIAGATTLSTDADVTLSTANFAADQARSAILLCTGARTVLRNINAPLTSKVYAVINATTGGFGVTLRGTTPTTGVTIPSGSAALCAWNGSDFIVVASNNLTANHIGLLPVTNGGTGVSTSTGTGSVVLSTSPTLTTPILDSINGGQLAGFRNRIINGDMRIDQRNNSSVYSFASVLGQYTLDRWYVGVAALSTVTVQQIYSTSISTPATLGVVSLAATAVSAANIYMLRQPIEAHNVSDFMWGTASAKTVTLSFKVYCTLTGTFGGAITNALQNRSYPFTYSIPVANTWTTISITIPGDTAGTWSMSNVSGSAIGVDVSFGLGVGTTYSGTAGVWAGAYYRSATGAASVVSTNGAAIYFSAVQLEVGSVATPFEQRPYSAELTLCQRYFESIISPGGNTPFGLAFCTSTSSATAYVKYTTPKRTTTPTGSNTSAALFSVTTAGGGVVATSLVAGIQGPHGGAWSVGTAAILTVGQGCIFSDSNTTGAFLRVDAEFP